jgi:hypothetical protein
MGKIFTVLQPRLLLPIPLLLLLNRIRTRRRKGIEPLKDLIDCV